MTSETYQSALRAFNHGKAILESLRKIHCSVDTSIRLLDVAWQPPVSPVVEAASEHQTLAESEINKLALVFPSDKERAQVELSGNLSDFSSLILADQVDTDAKWSLGAFEDDLIGRAAAAL